MADERQASAGDKVGAIRLPIATTIDQALNSLELGNWPSGSSGDQLSIGCVLHLGCKLLH
jgi:hypothetical protein